MAKSEQQRQKKLAKKRSKDLRSRQLKARHNQAMQSLAVKMRWAGEFSIYKCLASKEIFGSSGIGSVFLTRKLPDGQLAFMFLLIDALCLGVKDAGGKICTVSEFEHFLEHMDGAQRFESVEPSYARKLTEQAIAYAESLGLAPHPEYRRVSPLWGDVDSSECQAEFTFGRDGKPLYICGPRDDEARQHFILNRLSATVGTGNFHFAIGGSMSEEDEYEGGYAFNDFDDADDVVELFGDDEEDESLIGLIGDSEGGPIIEGKILGR